jgi:hypothetical protein
MGYLIQSTIIKESIIIPALEVQNLSIAPKSINKLNSINKTILAAFMQVENVPGNQIDSFGHFYLTFNVLEPNFAVYDENISAIKTTHTYNFILNMTHPPNRFGGIQDTTTLTQYLQISTELPAIANCDLIVTVYYFNHF